MRLQVDVKNPQGVMGRLQSAKPEELITIHHGAPPRNGASFQVTGTATIEVSGVEIDRTGEKPIYRVDGVEKVNGEGRRVRVTLYPRYNSATFEVL